MNPVAPELKDLLPIAFNAVSLLPGKTGLVIVDEVNGFATPGAGNLAPSPNDPLYERMIAETDRLSKIFTQHGWPILAFRDTHAPGQAEPPYPEHCVMGTGEEELVPQLKWLENEKNVTLMNKDCINGFIGGYRPDGSNQVLDWINNEGLEQIIVVGVCTDICAMDFVLTMLSVRNHGMTDKLKDIVAYEKGMATYDLPADVARQAGLPETAIHPQKIAHHTGLYMMASRGAILADRLTIS